MKTGENIVEAFYYVITFILGTVLLQNSDFLPWYLGGNQVNGQDLSNLMNNYPLISHPKYMNSFFFANLGFHMMRFFQLIALPVDKRRKDFLEMLLHHGATFILFTGAYVINYVSIGMLVVYAIDFNNIFVHICKSLAGTTYENTTNFIGMIMWITWVYCRLIAMPCFIYMGNFVYFY